MTIAIYSHSLDYLPTGELQKLLSYEDFYKVKFIFNKQYSDMVSEYLGSTISTYCTMGDLPADTKCLMSFGGDGTFLHAVTFMGDSSLPIMGINTGRLGFLSSTSKNDIATLLESLINNEYIIEDRSMITAVGDFSGNNIRYTALNEFTLQKNGLNMISVDVYVSGDFVATYMADGIIVSTPTGSTAYSLSVGGPIIAPGCECFIINPIAPHNLTMRPLIVDQKSSISMKVTTRNNSCIATLDNRSFEVSNDAEFTLSLSPKRIHIIKMDVNSSFYDTLRKKLMWAIDKRDVK